MNRDLEPFVFQNIASATVIGWCAARWADLVRTGLSDIDPFGILMVGGGALLSLYCAALTILSILRQKPISEMEMDSSPIAVLGIAFVLLDISFQNGLTRAGGFGLSYPFVIMLIFFSATWTLPRKERRVSGTEAA